MILCGTRLLEMAIITKALVASKANESLKFEDVYLKDLRPDEALVEIHAVGICHADISCLNGTIPVNFPCVFGHEGLLNHFPESSPPKG